MCLEITQLFLLLSCLQQPVSWCGCIGTYLDNRCESWQDLNVQSHREFCRKSRSTHMHSINLKRKQPRAHGSRGTLMSQGCWCCLHFAGVCEHVRVSVCSAGAVLQLGSSAALAGHQQQQQQGWALPQLARQIHSWGWNQLEQLPSLLPFHLPSVTPQWDPAEPLVLSWCNLCCSLTWCVAFGSWRGEDFHAQCTGLHQKAFFYIRQWAFPSQTFKKQNKYSHTTWTVLSSLRVLFSVKVIATLICYNEKLKLWGSF